MHKSFIILLSLTLVGCASLKGDEGMFRNRAKDYHGAHLVASLEVPADVAAISKSDLYPVLDIAEESHGHLDLEPPYFEEGVD